MNATKQLHDLGQSIWLDNITRGMLNDGTLAKYIADHDVTGLTSNPSIFDKAISGGHDYDDAIADLLADGQHGEDLFFSLAMQDLTRAAEFTSANPQIVKVEDRILTPVGNGRTGERQSKGEDIGAMAEPPAEAALEA